MQCRIFCSTLGFYLLEHVTIKPSVATAKCHLGGKIVPGGEPLHKSIGVYTAHCAIPSGHNCAEHTVGPQ